MNSDAFIPSPEDLGGLLAASLFEGLNPDRVEGLEFQILKSSQVPLKTYVLERMVLRACAAGYAIRNYLQRDVAKVVQHGFHTWFEEKAKQSEVFKIVQARIQEQQDKYAEAAMSDEEENDDGAVGMSHVAEAFSDALAEESAGSPSTNGVPLLAMSFADAYWDAQIEGLQGIFKKANLY